MVRGFNKVLLIGNLTRDPELRYTPSNTAVADLGLAVSRTYRNASGETQEDVVFVDVTVWDRAAENCSQYLSKGSPVFIEGRLKFDSWENQEGQRRNKLSVTARRVDFLGGPRNQEPAGAFKPAGNDFGNSDNSMPDNATADDLLSEADGTDDDIPF